MGMVLTDLSKPSTVYAILLCKLQNLGTSNKAPLWIESYLTNRQQFTRVATSLSEPLTITHGVPQGSIQGPTLFSLYMNDHPKSLSLVTSNLTLMTLRYISRLRQKVLIHVYAKLMRILNMLQSGVVKKNCKLHVYPRSTLEFIWTRLNVSVRSRSNWNFFFYCFFFFTLDSSLTFLIISLH